MSLNPAAASPVLPGLIAIVLYLAGTGLQARTLAHNAKLSMRLLTALAAPAIVLHAIAVHAQMDAPGGVNLGLLPVASLTALIMVALVTVLSTVQPVRSLLVVLFPLSALALSASLVTEPTPKAIEASHAGLGTHIFVSILAYSILMMAAIQSIVLGFVERSIRTRSHILLLRILPPLETMERLLFAMIWAGFAALTAAIGSGFLYLDDLFAQHVVHHTVLTSLSWAIYGGLLAGRLWLGWRGASAVRWTIIAFTFLLLGYFGSKFVLEMLLQRG